MTDYIHTPDPANYPTHVQAYVDATAAYGADPTEANATAMYNALAQVLADTVGVTVVLHNPSPGVYFWDYV